VDAASTSILPIKPRSLSLERLARQAQAGAALAVFFLVPWWWRPGWSLPNTPYFTGFLIAVPYALTLILWALTGLGDRRKWKALRPWLIPWLLLTVWVFVSRWWSRFPDPATDAAWQLVAIMVFAVAMATSGPPTKAVIGALGAGAFFQSVIAIGQVARQGPVGLSAIGEYEILPDSTGLSYLKVNGIEWLRPYGLTVHPNTLGGFLAVAVIGVGTLLVIRPNGQRPRWLTVVLAMATAMSASGLLFTFSRSAWIALAASGAMLYVVCARWVPAQIDWRRLRLVLVGLAGLTLVFAVAYHDLVFARTGLGDESGELRSISDREVFIGYTLRMIAQQPVIGLGVGMNAWASAQMIRDDPRQIDMQAQSVHDVPLLIWSELGLVGLLLWGAAWLGAGWIMFRVRHSLDPLALALVAGGVAMFGAGLFDYYGWGLFHFGLLWWGILGVALHSCVTTPPANAPPDRNPKISES